MRLPAVVLSIGLFLVLPAAPVLAHAELRSSSPAAGAELAAAPHQLRLELSELPSRGSLVTVTDGCGHQVGGELRVNGDSLSVPVGDGQPGRWRVDYGVVSSDDGHLSSGSFAFTVGGSTGCDGSAGPAKPAAATSLEPEGSTAMLVAALLGLGSVVSAAYLVRRKTALAGGLR